jgi:hypothetical protein
MGISPWYVGQTAPIWEPALQAGDGTPLDLTFVTTIETVIRNVQTGALRAGTGTWTFLHDETGTASYAWSAADVAEPGQYELLVTLTYTDGKEYKFDPATWHVEPY